MFGKCDSLILYNSVYLNVRYRQTLVSICCAPLCTAPLCSALPCSVLLCSVLLLILICWREFLYKSAITVMKYIDIYTETLTYVQHTYVHI